MSEVRMIVDYRDPYLKNIAFRTTDLHAAFMDKRVFVAGSTGFYGAWFMAFFRYLRIQHGINVAVQGGSRREGWNIMDERSHMAFQREAHYVINAVGSAQAATREELDVHRYSPGLLYSGVGWDCERFLQISTGAIGGESPYAQAKAAAERTLGGGGIVQIVRPFATVGPGMPLDTHFAIAAFIRNAKEGRPLMVRPGIVRSFVHVADLIVQMLHAMIHGDGQPYEVGSDDAISLEDAARLFDRTVIVSHKDFPTNAAAERYVCDLTRVRAHFNLSLDWDSRAAVIDTWRHYQA